MQDRPAASFSPYFFLFSSFVVYKFLFRVPSVPSVVQIPSSSSSCSVVKNLNHKTFETKPKRPNHSQSRRAARPAKGALPLRDPSCLPSVPSVLNTNQTMKDYLSSDTSYCSSANADPTCLTETSLSGGLVSLRGNNGLPRPSVTEATCAKISSSSPAS